MAGRVGSLTRGAGGEAGLTQDPHSASGHSPVWTFVSTVVTSHFSQLLVIGPFMFCSDTDKAENEQRLCLIAASPVPRTVRG